MQIFIVIIIISVAVAYLNFKWLPKTRTQKLISWIAKKAPKLAQLMKMSENSCSAGCSSCGGCADTSVKKNLDHQNKIIKIFPNSSATN